MAGSVDTARRFGARPATPYRAVALEPGNGRHIVRLEEDHEIAARADPITRRALFEFEHEKALSQASFAKAYEETQRARPLGDAPLLVLCVLALVLAWRRRFAEMWAARAR